MNGAKSEIIIYKSMEKEGGEGKRQDSRNRQTTYGMTSHEMSKIEQFIQKIVNTQDLSLSILIPALQKNPIIREQTELLQAIFKKKQMVEDMIRFLLVPHQMSAKYQLTTEQAKKYIQSILLLMKDNEQFYEFYFLLLEENSQLYSQQIEGHHVRWRRKQLKSNGGTLDVWFEFLEDRKSNKDEFQASLGFFAEVFIPFVKFYFSESSRICDYYEQTYQMTGPIWLITHFYTPLLNRILKYTNHQAIFDCLFTVIRVSIDEQEWIDSLDLLRKLCQSCIVNEITSDDHMEYLYKMVKEIRDNISKDKNGTVFAFLDGISSSELVAATLKRLESFCQKVDKEDEIIIELNFKLLMEIIHIYHALLEINISKTTKSVEQLRYQILLIKSKMPKLFELVKKNPDVSIHFSNGENLTTTPMFIYYFLHMCRYWLLAVRDYCQDDAQLSLVQYRDNFLALIQNILAQNRWSSIMHTIIEKIISLIITTEHFKAQNNTLKKFLQFLIEAFANKKYVFLNSCRLINQGDIRSLYSICCKITKSFQGACKTFGVNNQYTEWSQFVVNVLKNYSTKSEKSIFLNNQEVISESMDLSEGVPSPPQQTSFLGYIDEADELAQIKRSIDRIDTIQKWKNNNNKKINIQRSGSIPQMELRKKGDSTGIYAKRQTTMSPLTACRHRQRGSIPEPKVSKSGITLLNIKKQSSVQMTEQEILFQPFRMEKIISVDKEGNSSDSDTEARPTKVPGTTRKRSSRQ